MAISEFDYAYSLPQKGELRSLPRNGSAAVAITTVSSDPGVVRADARRYYFVTDSGGVLYTVLRGSQLAVIIGTARPGLLVIPDGSVVWVAPDSAQDGSTGHPRSIS